MAITALQKTRLVVFIILMAAIAVVFVGISLGKQYVTSHDTYYAVFEGESLAGLEKGASLQFYGIPIGYIDKISYDPKNLSRIKVTFFVEEEFPVMSDMRAQTVIQGVTGGKSINLMGGDDPDAQELEPGSVIPTDPSIMSFFADQAEDFITQLNETIENFNRVFDNVDKVVENVDRLTGEESHIAAILQNSANITVAVERLTDTIGEIGSSVKTTVDNTEEVTRRINQLVTTISDETDIAGLVTNVDEALRAIRNVSQQFAITAEQSREDISVMTESFRDASVNINVLSQQLRDNPSLILRGKNIQRREID
jgi:phospholipid/cholesterol/gamma-HCH transport system substrate-binding protein